MTPTSRVRFGLARVDITPPIGIYHRVWGAARHDRAAGIHRPLLCDVLVIGSVDAGRAPMLRVQLDLCGLVSVQHHRLVTALARAGALPPEQVVITYSHTHASGWFAPDRVSLPGGDLIDSYLFTLETRACAAVAEAAAAMREVTIEYAVGHCSMVANRDYWDDVLGAYTCGFNPRTPADETVVVGRISDQSGDLVGTLVNYGCHPTTLGWENTLLSPDYVGSLREEVERATGQPCIFFLGACGDLGPRHGFVGDPTAADQNGRQVAYAALSTLSGLGPPGTTLRYEGAVISGATLGSWRYQPVSRERMRDTTQWSGGTYTVALPLKDRPDADTLHAEVDRWEGEAAVCDARGEPRRARDCVAYAERARRRLEQLDDFPVGTTYSLSFSVHRMGDAIWVSCGGEPYSALQVELRRRFPDRLLVVSPLRGDIQVGYLLTADRYGLGLYEEEPSILAQGCLETLIEAMANRITEHLSE